jgi:3-oxoacyl-[acyl-carrier-protein] synthase-3
MSFRSQIIGCGAYLPEKIVTNADLPAELNTSDEWIRERTGIERRHVVSTETCANLGAKAAREALSQAGLCAEDVDAIIVATTTPDNPFPAVAMAIQSELQATRAFGFDIQAACSGFVYAMSVADQFIRTGHAKTILVIGCETMSRLLDWTDRGTCVLFGDGAGALVLQAVQEKDPRHVLSTHLFSNGDFYKSLYVDPSYGSRGFIKMEGREIFKHAVQKIGEAVEAALTANNLTAADIQWFVPHQANKRIINGVCEKFNLPLDRVIFTVQDHANTSAASIPLALTVGVQSGRIKKGDLVLLESLGGGLTWGSALIRW